MLRNALFAVTVGTLATVGAAKAQESAAAKAIEAAKQFAGTTITVTAEAGLQALLDKQFTGPEFEKLTGVKVNVVELPERGDLSEDHSGASGRYRRLRRLLMSPAWLADIVGQWCGLSRSIPISRNMASSPSSTTSIPPSRTG